MTVMMMNDENNSCGGIAVMTSNTDNNENDIN